MPRALGGSERAKKCRSLFVPPPPRPKSTDYTPPPPRSPYTNSINDFDNHSSPSDTISHHCVADVNAAAAAAVAATPLGRLAAADGGVYAVDIFGSYGAPCLAPHGRPDGGADDGRYASGRAFSS